MFLRRDNGYVDCDGFGNCYDTNGNSFWYTRTGSIVRYSIALGLFVLILAFLIGGYWHAKRRLNAGLEPLAYHRWLVRRHLARQTPQAYPMYVHPAGAAAPPAYGAPGYGYAAPGYAPPYGPPPAGTVPGPHGVPYAPPAYSPPPGATKTMADQDIRTSFAPPPGPPPGHAGQQETVASGAQETGVQEQHGRT